jgi:hypothetical protein
MSLRLMHRRRLNSYADVAIVTCCSDDLAARFAVMRAVLFDLDCTLLQVAMHRSRMSPGIFRREFPAFRLPVTHDIRPDDVPTGQRR